MPLYTKHGKEYELPDVTEQPVDEAIDLLENEGFNPIVVDSVFDTNYPPGAVIRQNPLPYTIVKKGRRIYMVVSIGKRPLYMPALIGLTPKDAGFRLKEHSLNLNNTIYEFSEFYPEGVVINQSVPAGEQVERNRNINITVSLGPPPSSQEIPNLVGRSMNHAIKELESIGLKKPKINYQYRPNLVPKTVLAQSVPPGTAVKNVKSMTLNVSTDIPIEKPEKEDPLKKQPGDTTDE